MQLRRLLSLVTFLGPDLLALSVLGTLVLVVSQAYGKPLHGISGSTWMPVATLAVLALVAVAKHGRSPSLTRRIGILLRDWAPLVLAILVYDNFHDLTYLIAPNTVDNILAAADTRLLGAPASMLLQPITTPWLTELMTFCYALFFVFPTIVLIRAYTRSDRFREAGVAMSLAFYIGLVGYMLVPAVGPRYAFPERFSVPLDGILLTEPGRLMWRSLQQVDRDCFPSLHTAMSTIALVYLWRLRWMRRGRALFWVSLPFVAGLWLSTIYLRYHHFVDVLAGFVLAAVCVYFAPRLTAAFEALRRRL